MRKLLVSLFVVLSSLSLCLQSASAAPKKDFISKSEHDALWAAFPALKEAEDEMERVYRETRNIVGEEGGGGAWLGREQTMWGHVYERIALSKGDLGSPELVQFLIDSAKERTTELQKIAAEGRIVERQIYKGNSGVERYLEIWRYEGDKVKVDLWTFPENGDTNCSFHSRMIGNADDTWSIAIPDFQNVIAHAESNATGYTATLKKEGQIDCLFSSEILLLPDEAALPDAAVLQAMGMKITTDAQGYTATVERTGSTPDLPKGIATFAGEFRRTNKVSRADDPTLEEVTTCTLGADRSQKIRLLRNNQEIDSYVYYLDSSLGLLPLDSFADKKLSGTFDEVNYSRGSFLSFGCVGDKKERVLIVTGQFTSGYLHIHVIRYNSTTKEWQVLNTAERNPPTLVYLGNTDMKVVMPNAPPSEIVPFLVHVVGSKKTTEREQKKLPAAKGYRIIHVMEKDLMKIDTSLP